MPGEQQGTAGAAMTAAVMSEEGVMQQHAEQQQTEMRQGGENRGAPLGGRYEADGRRLFLHRSGSGGPAVVFLPGSGLVGLDYLPRTAAEVTGELHKLLRATRVPPPYLLVGHSLGGACARRYAQRYPDEVAGVLFLDPYQEGYLSFSPKRTIGGTLWQVYALARLAVSATVGTCRTRR
jgi:pimeloyl-ACP methyl ester carboxylesterase